MATNHISREQLVQYRNRTLAPQDLVAVDAHIGGCQECREELGALATSNTLDAVREARFEHITYEQMDAWVENELDQSERELVLSHIGLCAPCARQLRAYEGYAPAMSASIVQPAQPVAATFGEKLRAWLWTPRAAMVAAAVAAVAILGPMMSHDSNKALTMAQLEALPDSVRSSAKDVINGDSAARPEALNGLAPNHDSTLQYPVSEVVEERQPVLRWASFGSSYTVALYDASGREIANSGMIAATHWLVPVQLARGEQYTWKIEANLETRQASFKVLDASNEEKLRETRLSGAPALAMGAVAQNMGLLSEAQRDFESAKREQPGSKDAARMLERVNELRGR